MKEVKACYSFNCENTLPASSKHKRCPRCRAYDRRVAGRSPRWQVERYTSVSRWEALLVDVLPKKEKERVSAGLRAIAPSNSNSKIEPIRKRA